MASYWQDRVRLSVFHIKAPEPGRKNLYTEAEPDVVQGVLVFYHADDNWRVTLALDIRNDLWMKRLGVAKELTDRLDVFMHNRRYGTVKEPRSKIVTIEGYTRLLRIYDVRPVIAQEWAAWNG